MPGSPLVVSWLDHEQFTRRGYTLGPPSLNRPAEKSASSARHFPFPYER
jgi:hypothetical protein